MSGKTSIEVPYTRECEDVAKSLKEAGFLSDVKVFKDTGKSYKRMRIDVAYDNGNPKVTDVSRLSKPGRRIYKGYADITKVAGGFGVLIVSTSRGIMSGTEAKKKKLGGELICSVR